MGDYKANYQQIVWNHTVPVSKRATRASNGPAIVGDYEAYECPITGKMIEGRAAHAENLKRHDCRILEPGEKEDNARRGREAVEAENRKRDAVIDAIAENVGNEYFR